MHTISPTHALLLLLKKHQPTYARPSTSEREKYREISTMLFTGRTTENAVKFDAYMLEAESTGTPGYRIDRTPAFIHNNPVRRYFETYLAHTFLQRQLNKISSETIDAILDTYRSKLSQDIPTKHMADRDNEFGIAMRVAAKHNPRHYSETQRQKLTKLIDIGFQGFEAVLTSTQNDSLPLPLYTTGIYHGATGRGRDMRSKEDSQKPHPDLIEPSTQDYRGLPGSQKWTTSSATGILRSIDPLPACELMQTSELQVYRAPDRSAYVEGKIWPTLNFPKLTDPFVNSISGTMLCQLRTILDFINQGMMPEAPNLPAYLTLVASTLLVFLGGHTYNEFMSPLKLPQVIEAYRAVGHDFSDFKYWDLLLEHGMLNPSVLDKSLEYAKTLETRQAVRTELAASGGGLSSLKHWAKIPSLSAAGHRVALSGSNSMTANREPPARAALVLAELLDRQEHKPGAATALTRPGE